MAPSTFASAAAGSNSRNEGGGASGGNDWSRRVNGATQTFRRPSTQTTTTTTTSSSHQRESSSTAQPTPTPNPSVYVPPSVGASRNPPAGDSRFSKGDLLRLFRHVRSNGDQVDAPAGLYVQGWEPTGRQSNGTSGGSWGRREENSRDSQPGADVCWDASGESHPLGLVDFTDEEKELFSSSVNSPIKPPNQTVTKDGAAKDTTTTRKTSLSQQTSGPFGLGALNTARTTNRRREVSETYSRGQGYSSPITTRFTRDDSHATTPPPALLRRATDAKDSPGNDEAQRERPRDATDQNGSGFATLKRSTTAPFSAGLNGPSSPWSAGPQSAGFPPMGAFNNFGSGAQQAPTPTEKRFPFGAGRGESRFRGLMNRDSSEDMTRGVQEKLSSGNLGRLGDAPRNSQAWMETFSKRAANNDPNLFPGDNVPAGSAALGGGRDTSPPRDHDAGTPRRQKSRDEGGLSAFGMTDTSGARNRGHPSDPYHQTPQHQSSGNGEPEPMSPTDTNPYQSPEQDKTDEEDDDTNGSDIQQSHLPGLGGFGDVASGGVTLAPLTGLGGLGRNQQGHDPTGDGGQSSAGPNRSLPGLGSLGGLPGLGGPWSATQPAVGTPNRERSGFTGFGDGMGGPAGDMQMGGLPGLGSTFAGHASNMSGSGTIGRGSSKMGSLFPTAMQDQMRGAEPARPLSEDADALERLGMSGSLNRAPFGGNAQMGAIPTRDNESPFRPSRGMLDNFLTNLDTSQRSNRQHQEAQFSEPDSARTPFALGPTSTAIQSPPSTVAAGGHGSSSQLRSMQSPEGSTPTIASNSGGQASSAQQRTMVMPDRMRWIYRDPQGNTQGPWSGLEMHDWYKAGFFNPDLLVKKFEDPEYEPLAQLIRRIGNSREPFLVPQIGIPHGPAQPQPSANWQSPLTGPTGPAQPPFANSFPSFGTTLTADQQNALERRKQEEQYLMARQKEHLTQQQNYMKMYSGAQQLHHHSSAHSLHSQPSFGSINSPSGYQPSPTQGPMSGGPAGAGFAPDTFRQVSSHGSLVPSLPGSMEMLRNIREEDLPAAMEQMSLAGAGRGPPPGSGPFNQTSDPNLHAQQVAAMMNDRARLQREQAEHDAAQQGLTPNEQEAAAQASADRLHQFQGLQADRPSAPQFDANQSAPYHFRQVSQSSVDEDSRNESFLPQDDGVIAATAAVGRDIDHQPQSEPLSLTEQVQKAASAKHAPVPVSPWAKVDVPTPQVLSQKPSSPLPAPAAQRKQNLADALASAEVHPDSRSASVGTPPSASVAPWAKETNDSGPRGPSLREIQEAEARKAAQQEEVASAARRAAMEKEILLAQQQPLPAPGLPSSANWASSMASPGGAASTAPSAWAKPLAGKAGQAASAGMSNSSKKTLQQIQKEEEARKQRSTSANATGAANSSSTQASGKRYADLASKGAPATGPTPGPGGVWTTVGAGGKSKTPAGSTPTAPASVNRVPSGSAVPNAARARPAVAIGARGVSGAASTSGPAHALDELRKWAVAELRNDLNDGVNVEEFVDGLLSFPTEVEILTEAVHSVSKTVDSRHFAEQFIRRRKLADKGIVDPAAAPSLTSPPAGATGGGWSEVAKKGTAPGNGPNQRSEEVTSGNFKVVAAKKKGGRK